MKKLRYTLIAFVFLLKLNAQTSVITNTILVKGNCGECKERIENAADIKGVKHAVWSETSQVLTITFNPKKVTLQKIEMAIAKVGHKTSNQMADTTAYKALPNCCKYESTDCKKK